MTIEVTESDGRTVEAARDAAFQSMILDNGGACNDVISIRAEGEREIHRIIDPVYILLRESGQGYNPVEIQHEQGRTLLTFHPAIHQDVLQGLEVLERRR